MKLEDILNDRLKVLYRRLKKVEKILNSNKNRLKEINESQEFRLVVYKKENILSRIISFISIGLEKIKIMRNSRTNAMKKAYNK